MVKSLNDACLNSVVGGASVIEVALALAAAGAPEGAINGFVTAATNAGDPALNGGLAMIDAFSHA